MHAPFGAFPPGAVVVRQPGLGGFVLPAGAPPGAVVTRTRVPVAVIAAMPAIAIPAQQHIVLGSDLPPQDVRYTAVALFVLNDGVLR